MVPCTSVYIRTARPDKETRVQKVNVCLDPPLRVITYIGFTAVAAFSKPSVNSEMMNEVHTFTGAWKPYRPFIVPFNPLPLFYLSLAIRAISFTVAWNSVFFSAVHSINPAVLLVL